MAGNDSFSIGANKDDVVILLVDGLLSVEQEMA
jgi:hypothetical protein